MLNNNFKFAKFVFARDIDEIPIKFNFLKYAPKNVFSWYVDKYNPYILSDFEIGDEIGYLVKLPFTFSEYQENSKRCKELIANIVDDLHENKVEIVVMPKEISFYSDKIIVANGKTLMIFLIYNIITKSLKAISGNIQNAEISIIDNDCEECEEVLSIIQNIYREINHLTIFSDYFEMECYKKLAFNVFDDTGLRVHISKMSKKLLAESDIVINLSEDISKFAFQFKRNAIFIDLSYNEFARKEIIYKRSDMKIIDGIRIKWIDRIYELNSFEAGMYQKLPKYQKYLKYGFADGLSEISSFLENETRITSLTLLGDKIR